MGADSWQFYDQVTGSCESIKVYSFNLVIRAIRTKVS